MPRSFKASGKNDIWFALFFIIVILVAALLPHDRGAHSSRPAPVPADVSLKD